MKYFYDLHIHSVLSPCGDADMTPNNIVNMAAIKGLDIIAVTDHNSILNLPAILKCAENLPITVVPGMEIESEEEVHILSLFPTYEDAENTYNELKKYRSGIKNRSDIFGEQVIMNEYDEIIGHEDDLLVTALRISIEKIKELVEINNGIAIPAHIDRNSYSVISNLGVIPDIGFRTLELSKDADKDNFKDFNFNKITNSDAHYLEDISEPEFSIDLEEKSAKFIVNFLKTKKY